MDERIETSVLVVGAGFSGMAIGIALRRAGIHDFTIVEATDGVGGTWRVNTYPGCACDIPSHLYSFSFERNPRWSRAFGPQPEILEYLEHCADKYGLRPHLRLNTEVEALRWVEADKRWHVDTAGDGPRYAARVVVSGAGGLSKPAVPAIPGLSDFEGPCFHSARWDHAVDLRGRDVAVIGTGASAIQIVPAIADDVRSLHVFQRTAPWVVSKPDGPIPERLRELYTRHPSLTWLQRGLLYGVVEALGIPFFVEPRLMRVRQWSAKRHIRRQIADPELRAKVTPTFTMGCKRVLFSDDWYPTLAREHVELVTDPIETVTRKGVVTRDGREREVDAIVLCTGFAVRDFLAPMSVVGRGGLELGDAWRDGAEAYYGMAVHGFPNLFIMVGPNTGLGHNSMVIMIEAQARYIRQCIEMILDRGVGALEVKPETQRRFNDRLQERMADVVWTSGCKSWYLDEQGRNFALWPASTLEYRLRTLRPDPRAFTAG